MRNLKLIGKGKFGKIYDVEDDKGDKFALKVVDSAELSYIELDILSRLKSPYIIRSLDIGIINSNLGKGIPIEIKENNLCSFVTTQLTGGQIKRIFMSLILGMKCMHKNGFLHLDIKPRNCLYDKTNGLYTGYLSDFGMSIRCNNAYEGITKKNKIGTLKYFPYEILKNKGPVYVYNDKSDVWSLGITLLCILDFDFKLNFNPLEKKEEKIDKTIKFWDNLDLSSAIYKYIDKPFFSEIDKIDLHEMFTHMLKKESSDRISSRDFHKLRFFNSNSLEDDCYITKPKEVLFIPYSSTNVIKGINKLRSYFKNVHHRFRLEVYFLSVEIFIRIMAISPIEISKKTLEKNIQMAFLTSVKYYNLVKLSDDDLRIFKDNSYDIAELLEGDIAPNSYYYKAKYIEDLILVDEIILKNYNMTCFYNYLNIEELYSFFRQNYIYKDIKRNSINTCKEFFDLVIPIKNTENMIENDRRIFSFKDVKSKQKIKSEEIPEIDKIQDVEARFRKIFLDYLKKNMNFDSEKNMKEVKFITECKDIVYFYNKYFKDKELNIYDTLIDFDKDIDFGIIEEDIYGKFTFKGKMDSRHFLFKSKNVISLLVKNLENSKVIHYYSTYNENLRKYFYGKNFDYSNDYKLKTTDICKINEICILFLIYYNTVIEKEEYNIIYLQDKTLKTVLTFCLEYENKNKKIPSLIENQ